MSQVIPEYNLDEQWSYADTETSYPKSPFCFVDIDFMKMPLIAMDEETTKEAQLLQAELDLVEKGIRDLQSQKTNILSDLSTLEQDLSTLEQEASDALCQVVETPSKPHVVAFVAKIEQAHLYFKLKEFLKKSDLIKYDTVPSDDFIDHLFNNQQGMAEFDKLDREHVQTALTVRIQELRIPVYPKFRESFKLYKQQDCPGWGDTTHVSEAEQELEFMFPTLNLESQEVVDEFVIVNPFVNLVHRMRSENYVMNENPEVELGKLMKCFPLHYQDSELVCDPLRLMTPPPDMGSDVDEVFSKAVDKYKELYNAGFMTKKRQRSMSSESSM